MTVTHDQLRQIIKEELEGVLMLEALSYDESARSILDPAAADRAIMQYQVGQMIQEELSIVLAEDMQSLQQPDILQAWVPSLNNSQYQRLYDTTGGGNWAASDVEHGMLTKQGETKEPIMAFTARSKDTAAGLRWRVWAMGGNFSEDTPAYKKWGSIAGKIYRVHGRDSLMRDNLPVEKLPQAIDDIVATIRKSTRNEN